MLFKIGDLVTRKSYDNDILFKIINIIEDTAYLKGIDIRLIADSNIDDLEKYDCKSNFNDEEISNLISEEINLERSEYFYLPGKILHIDADHLCNSEFEKVL